jgi:nucleoid-associated protein YgaU
MRKFLTASVLVVAGLLMFALPPVYAVDYGGVGGKPAHPVPGNSRTQSIFIYTLKAGQTKSDGIRIVNNTSKSQTIDVYPTDSQLASGGNFTCAQRVEPRKDVGGWIKLSNNQVKVPSNDNVVIPFTITAPASPSVGEHDGCIAIQTADQNKTTAKSGVVLSFRSAIRVAVTIPGKIVKALAIKNIKTSTDDNDVIVTPTLHNTGNVSLDTKVKVSLDGFGFGAVDNGGNYPVLPKSEASWNFTIKKPFWGGWYRATITATYNSTPSSGIGVSKGVDKTLVKKSGVFFVTPAPAAIAIYALIILVLIGLVWWYLRGRMRKKHIKVKWRTYKVKENDTIVKVAKQHDVAWKRLAAANKLKAPYHLEPGQELRVPPHKGS